MSTPSGHRISHVIVGGTGAVGTVIADVLIAVGHRVSLLIKPSRKQRLLHTSHAETPFLAVYDLNKRQNSRIQRALLVALSTIIIVLVLYGKSLVITASLALLLSFATFVSFPYSTAPYHIVRKFDILTKSSEMQQDNCDYLWLCCSLADITEGSTTPQSMRRILEAAPSHTVVILITPAVSDDILPVFPHPDRILTLSFNLIAYTAPLMAEEIPATHEQQSELPPGVARYYPPFISSDMQGDKRHAAIINAALNQGGMKTRVSQQFSDSRHFESMAVFFPLLFALELSGWSFSALFSPRCSVYLSLARHSAMECYALQHPPFLKLSAARVLLQPTVLRACLFVVFCFLPFDGEAYNVYHWSKHSEQTFIVMAEMFQQGMKAKRPMAATRALIEKVHNRRGDTEKRQSTNNAPTQTDKT